MGDFVMTDGEVGRWLGLTKDEVKAALAEGKLDTWAGRILGSSVKALMEERSPEPHCCWSFKYHSYEGPCYQHGPEHNHCHLFPKRVWCPDVLLKKQEGHYGVRRPGKVELRILCCPWCGSSLEEKEEVSHG